MNAVLSVHMSAARGVAAAAELLGTTTSASAKEKKAAFRAMAKLWHPDLHQGKPTEHESESKFKQLLAAYELLKHCGSYQEPNPASRNWRDQVYRGSTAHGRSGYYDSDARYEGADSQQEADFSGRSHAGYGYGAARDKELPVAAFASVALFTFGLLSFGTARLRRDDAARKHDHDWITRRSMGGWGGAKIKATVGERTGSTKPRVGNGGLPRQAQPYHGGAATAAAGIRIGDPEVPRDWATAKRSAGS